MPCPVCGGRVFAPFLPAAAVRREIRRREEFVLSRLGRKASPAELKDLTDFMHGFSAPLETCARCGMLIRAESRVRNAGSYSEDPNDLDLMKQLLPRYVRAFRNKEPGFRELLKPHADVLELGSHLGAFLQVAEEWNWRPVGLDVGRDTAEFAKASGLTVRRAMIEDGPVQPRSVDAVFVWNCFEQLQNPAPALAAIHRALRRHGLLVIRVPNALFYRRRRSDMPALAWNNLLGFPYLYGYTADHVSRLARQWGFEYVRGFDSELVTMPFPDLTARIAEEQKSISEKVGAWSIATTARSGRLTGPWIETVYRRMDGPAPLHRTPPDLHFLPRAA